jgi:hypothetical protein
MSTLVQLNNRRVQPKMFWYDILNVAPTIVGLTDPAGPLAAW